MRITNNAASNSRDRFFKDPWQFATAALIAITGIFACLVLGGTSQNTAIAIPAIVIIVGIVIGGPAAAYQFIIRQRYPPPDEAA